MHALARARRAACFMCYYRFGLVRAGARGVTWTGTVARAAETWELERWARGGRLLGQRAGGVRGRGVRVRAWTRAWRGDSAPARTWRHMSAHAHACTHAAATTETARCKIKAIDMISIHGR